MKDRIWNNFNNIGAGLISKNYILNLWTFMTDKKIFIRLISQNSFILLKSIFTKVIKNTIFHKANIKIKIHKKQLFYHKKILMNKC